MNQKKNRVAVIALSSAALLLFSSAAGYGATTLTTQQRQQLQFQIEEEKLARDVYNYLATNVTTQKFSNIAKSEQTHMDYIATLLKSYKVWNPTLNRKPGVFWNTELQKLYNDLIVSGKTGILEAFATGVTIENRDIADLQKIDLAKMPVDVKTALDLLLKGSQNHLAAFSR